MLCLILKVKPANVLFIYSTSFIFILSFYLVSAANEEVSRRTPVVEAVEKVGPAVVNINTEEIVYRRPNPFYGFRDPFFDDFFNIFKPPKDYRKQSLGSGVIIDPSGYILTNEHVILHASSITVTLIDKRKFKAKLIGADHKTDIAVIKIDAKEPMPYIEMGRSDDLIIGETVIAIGNSFGLSHTVTKGVISALNRNIKSGKERVYTDFIQIDASINPGNSGGPLLNIDGELIGINTAIFRKGKGIGFAIPINKARRIVDDLIRYGEVHRGWLGIFVQHLTPELADFFGLDDLQGILITKVFKDSPAEKAGLKTGDIIKAINGHKITGPKDYQDQVSSYTAGERIMIDYIDHKKKKTTAELVTTAIPEDLAEEIAKNWIGVHVSEITQDMVAKYNLFTHSGVLITKLDSDSVMERIGIFPGDVIRQINKQMIEELTDFRKAIIEAQKRKSILLLIQRGRYGYYVTVEP